MSTLAGDTVNNAPVNARPRVPVCRACGYDLSGGSLSLCPECGADAPRSTAMPDPESTQAAAPNPEPACTRCGRRWGQGEQGACACGAAFGNASGDEFGELPRNPGHFIDALAVIAAIIGTGVSLFAVVFGGLARSAEPAWGTAALGMAPAGALACTVWMTPLLRRISGELSLLVRAFLVALGLVCLAAAIAVQ